MHGDNFDPRDTTVEERIDTALRSYAEPPSSVSDARIAAAAILERARLAPARRPLWVWAIPAAACLLALAVGLAWWHPAPPAPSIARTAPPSPPVAESRLPAPAPSERPARIAYRQPVHPAGPPKLDVFPTPAPLSSEEQALLVFVRHAPPAVTQAVIHDQQHWSQPPGTPGLDTSLPELPGTANSTSPEPEKENR